MRYPYQKTSRNQEGAVVLGATVSVFLTGTSTAASVYAASSGGVAVNSVDSSSTDGTFLFYVDDNDYAADQRFDIVASKSLSDVATYIPVTLTDVAIFPAGLQVIDVRTITGTYSPTLRPNISYVLVITGGTSSYNIDPVVTAGQKYSLQLYNAGSGTLTLDSVALAYGVGGGDHHSFAYDGTVWNA